MGYTVKHYMSDDGYGGTGQEQPTAPSAPSDVVATIRATRTNRKTGQTTYGPEEVLPTHQIDPKDF
jgi:hypothetical protein